MAKKREAHFGATLGLILLIIIAVGGIKMVKHKLFADYKLRDVYKTEAYYVKHPAKFFIDTQNPNMVAITGKHGRVEIFEGSRVMPNLDGESQEDIDTFVPKETRMQAGQQVWIYYTKTNRKARHIMQKIADSVTAIK